MSQLDLPAPIVRVMTWALSLGVLSCNSVTTDLGGDGALSGGVPVAVAVPTVSLSIAPPLILLGQSATIAWNSTDATACQGSVSPAGSGGAWGGNLPVSNLAGVSVTPTVRGKIWYTLTCTGAGGSASATALLLVDTPPAPTVSLNASSLTASVGAAIVLTWASTDASSCGWSLVFICAVIVMASPPRL